jgi:hypothetical protein
MLVQMAYDRVSGRGQPHFSLPPEANILCGIYPLSYRSRLGIWIVRLSGLLLIQSSSQVRLN